MFLCFNFCFVAKCWKNADVLSYNGENAAWRKQDSHCQVKVNISIHLEGNNPSAFPTRHALWNIRNPWHLMRDNEMLCFDATILSILNLLLCFWPPYFYRDRGHCFCCFLSRSKRFLNRGNMATLRVLTFYAFLWCRRSTHNMPKQLTKNCWE